MSIQIRSFNLSINLDALSKLFRKIDPPPVVQIRIGDRFEWKGAWFEVKGITPVGFLAEPDAATRIETVT